MSWIRSRCVMALLALATSAATAPAWALDLPAALKLAAAANPTLAAKRSLAEAARDRVAPAGAWEPPMLEAGVINLPTTGYLNTDPMTMKMVGLSQRVPLSGRRGLDRRSAQESARAEAEVAGMTRNEVLGAAWEAYTDAYFGGEMARQAAEHQAQMDRLVRAAEARYESGSGRLEDMLRAEAERARLFADIAGYRSEALEGRARLDEACGGSAGPGDDSLATPPLVEIPASPGAWLAAIDPSNPRLREIDARVRGDRLAARASRRAIWPDLTVSATYGFRETLVGGTEHGIAIGDVPQDNMIGVTLGVELPIFASKREGAEAGEREAMARAGQSERIAEQLRLEREVRSIHAAASAARRMVSVLADTVVVVQRRTVEASWEAYSSGTIDLWRVFEASHSLYEEEIALLGALRELGRAEARLVALTGRTDLLGVPQPAEEAAR